jgi:protoheme IX farnesyltransferase
MLSLQVALSREADPVLMKPERRLFAFSIVYLFALFGALVVDRMVLA